MNYIQSKIKSGFIKSISILLSGTIVSQIINVAFLPLLTRLYNPEVFSELAIIVALSLFISTFLTLRYEVGIVLPKSNTVSDYLIRLSVLLLFATTLFLLIISNIFDGYIDNFLIIILASFFLGFNNIATYIAIRYSEYKIISISKIIQVFVTVISQLLFIYVFNLDSGLIYGYLIGLIISTTYFVCCVFKISYFNILIYKYIFFVAKKYIQFPLYNATQALVNSLSSNILIFTLKSLFGSVVLGQYSIAFRGVQTPASVVSSAVKQVIYNEFSKLYNEGTPLYSLFLKRTVILLLTSVIPVCVFYIFSVDIVTFVFGHQWELAGLYSKYIVIWVLFIYISTPATSILQVCNLQNYFFYYEMVLFLSRLLLIFIAFNFDLNALHFISFFCYLSAFFNFLLIVIVFFYLFRIRVKI